MTRVYYREAVGALVVFDMTRLSTFQAVLKWKGDLDSKVRCSKAGYPSSLKSPVALNPLTTAVQKCVYCQSIDSSEMTAIVLLLFFNSMVLKLCV